MLNFDLKTILAKMTMFWIISFQFPFNVPILLLGSSTWDPHVPLFHSLVAHCPQFVWSTPTCNGWNPSSTKCCVALNTFVWEFWKFRSKWCVDYKFYITFSSFDLGRAMFPIQTCRWMFHNHVLCKDACETMIGQMKM